MHQFRNGAPVAQTADSIPPPDGPLPGSKKVYIPPVFRFLTELTTWSWFIIAAFTMNLIYIVGFILSVGLLAVFNTPGDKAKDGPVNVP